MPQGAKLLLTILFIPFLMALSHDVYISYLSDDEKIKEVKSLRADPQNFMMSDVGWLWETYAPTSMEVVKDSVAQETWDNKIEPVLKQSSIVVTALPFIITSLYLLLSYIIGIWPFYRSLSTRDKKGNQHAVYKKAQTQSTKFSRKN